MILRAAVSLTFAATALILLWLSLYVFAVPMPYTDAVGLATAVVVRFIAALLFFGFIASTACAGCVFAHETWVERFVERIKR